MINPNNFLIGEIPNLNPYSQQYSSFWRAELIKCLGKWITPTLYFFVNHWYIKISKDKSKVQSLPSLRDIDWERAYLYEEAKGFSGFEDDTMLHCNRGYMEGVDPKGRSYVSAREYLRLIHPKSLGRPLYENPSMNIIELGGRGYGKDIEENTTLYTKYGKVKIKDINIGDEIFDSDGLLTKVVNKKHYNDQIQYKVVLKDGRSLICGAGHLWGIMDNKGKYKVLELREILKDYKKVSENRIDYKYFVPYTKPLQYDTKELPIDPYFLGLWLGDGNSHNIGITTIDEEIKSYVEKIAVINKLNINVYLNSKNTCPTYILNNDRKSFELRNTFNKLNLFNNKHIPEIYFEASVDQRLELLRGLLDTDGSIQKRGNIEFSNSNENIIKGIERLLKSLGIRYTISERIPSYKHKNELKNGKLTYRVNIISSLDIFKLTRKRERLNHNLSSYSKGNREKVAIADIQELGVKPSVCIAVDNESKLFVAGDDYIVTHNSYWVAACASHVFLFDGASSYREYREDKPSSEVVLSAQAQDYISTLVQHTYYGLNRLRGSIQKGKDYFPPPLAKEYSGSLSPNKFLLQEKEVKKGGSWVKEGSTSKMHCRIIGDDPFVSNGTRSKLIIIDETGFVPLLEEVFGSCKATTLNDSFKFGVIWATGTGGEMEGKGSIATKKIFYDPESYDCLSFQDEWENTGKIGLFVPGYYKRNECRDENGILDIEKARGYDLNERAKLEKSPSVVPLQIEKMNTPLVPSEVFLSKSGNKFPVNDLKAQLAYVESSNDEMLKGVIGTMIWSPETNKPEFKPDSSLKEVIYPVNPKNDNTGCVVIYEVPQLLPFGTYVAGIDPYAQDETTESVSVGTCYIMKRKVLGYTTQDQIVAKYVGRPESLNTWMEQVRRLLIYYGGLGLYENNYNHLKGHMELKNSLKFLANTPTVFKSSTNESKVLYGIRMTKDVKPEAELYLKNWLEEEVEEGQMNLHYILDKHLLKELIAYSDTGNYDAVIAIMLANVQRITMLKIIYKEKEKKPDPFFNRKLFRRN